MRKLGYIFFLLTAASLALELCLRLFDPVGITYVFEARDYFGAMEQHERYGYRHKPGHVGTYQGVEIRINEEGLRGKQFRIRKPSGSTRLLVLGDSVVFGWGVTEEHTLVPQLRRRLEAELPETYIDVIGAGVGGWNTRNEVEFFKERAHRYQADIVALVVVDNDIEGSRRGWTSVDKGAFRSAKRGEKTSWLTQRYRQLVRKSYLLTLVQRFFSVSTKSSDLEQLYRSDSPEAQDVRHALMELDSFCDEHSIHLVAFLYSSANKEVRAAYETFFRRELGTLGVPVYEYPDALYDSSYRLSAIDPHRNAAGLSIMADAMVPVLRQAVEQVTAQ